jgi:hypothetical protein
MLKEHGWCHWTVRAVYERDDLGGEDDIAGRNGRAFRQERLIWVNMRCAADDAGSRSFAVRIAHARLGPPGGRSARAGILGQAAGDRRQFGRDHCRSVVTLGQRRAAAIRMFLRFFRPCNLGFEPGEHHSPPNTTV